MTQTELLETFWTLYNTGRITVKTYEKKSGTVRTVIEAYEYNERYFLRIHTYVDPFQSTHTDRYGRKWTRTERPENHYIKEFNNRNHANNYFKKVMRNA